MNFDILTALWCVYFVETERFDIAACADRHREHGVTERERHHREAIPMTPFETRATRLFAHDANKRRAAAMSGADPAEVQRAKMAALGWRLADQEEIARRYLGPNAISAPNYEPYLRKASMAMLR